MTSRVTLSHVSITLLALATFGCGSTPAAAPTTVVANTTQVVPTASITGLYLNEHFVTGFEDGEEVEIAATDTLRIVDVVGELLQVAVELTGRNEHMCSFVGNFEPDATEPLTWNYASTPEEDLERESATCEVKLEHRDEGILISSEGCRYFCGDGMSLEAVFNYPPTSSDPDSQLTTGAKF